MSYRDDLQAARMRRDALARDVREVRGRMNEYQELERQAQTLERELDQCGRDLDQARRKVELPLLQKVRVASPCKERWDEMSGDEHVRFCGRCEKNVYDLSSLTTEQAESLLRERGESMCVRLFRRSDGTVLTSDCPVGGRKRFWRRVTAGAAAGVAAAGLTVAALGGHQQGGMVMGEMEPVMGQMVATEVGKMAVEELGGAPATYQAPSPVDFADPPPGDYRLQQMAHEVPRDPYAPADRVNKPRGDR
jgi:hypothetical protein